MKVKILASAVLAMGLAGAANAGPITLFPGLNLLEDDNREYLIKGTGNTLTGILQVGDKLRGVLEFGKIEEVDGTLTQNPIVPELTGIFETEIKSITDANNDGIAELIIWGPSAAFSATYGVGAMVATFAGGTNLDLVACPSIAACETAATDGVLWAVAGFGDTDDQWISTNSVLDFGAVAGLGSATKVATVNYALSILNNQTGYVLEEQALDCLPFGPFLCAGDGKTDLVGSGDVLGGRGLTNGYGARSDIDVTLNRVPEPATLALVGLALVGFGAVRSRKSV